LTSFEPRKGGETGKFSFVYFYDVSAIQSTRLTQSHFAAVHGEMTGTVFPFDEYVIYTLHTDDCLRGSEGQDGGP
jgi:hypothetical protein